MGIKISPVEPKKIAKITARQICPIVTALQIKKSKNPNFENRPLYTTKNV